MTISGVAQMTQDEYEAWYWTTELRTEFVDGQVVALSEMGDATFLCPWTTGS